MSQNAQEVSRGQGGSSSMADFVQQLGARLTELQQAYQQQTQHIQQLEQAQVQQAQAHQAELQQVQAQQQQVAQQVQQVNQPAQQVHVSHGNGGNGSLKPPKPGTFDGKRQSDVNAWLSELVRYFRASGVDNIQTDLRCVPYAVSMLRDDASIWWESHQTMIHEQELPEVEYWVQFEQAICEQFQPPNKSQQARDQLSTLVQKQSVLAYTAEFNRLCIRIDNLHHTEKLDRYIRGLKPHVRIEVQKVQPQSFSQAVGIAQTIDNIYFQNKVQVNFKSSSTYSDRKNYGGPVPMELGNIDAESEVYLDEDEEDQGSSSEVEVNAMQSRSTPLWKKLKITKDELYRRKKNRLCYRCGKPGHGIGKCKFSKPQQASTAATSPKN